MLSGVPRQNRGISLVETLVSIGLMTLIFATMAYLVFAVGRNSLVVREQAQSQNQAAQASERMAAILRNARFLKGYGSDNTSNLVNRIVFETPDLSQPAGIKEGVIAFIPASDQNASDGIIKIFSDSSDYTPDTVAEAESDWEYTNIHDFNIHFHSPSWVTLSVAYTYRGFRLLTTDSNNDGIHDNLLAGNFITDIIAKNHHPGESAQYAETTNTLIQL